MEDSVFEQFLIINQIGVPKSAVLCGACAHWLTPPTHTRGDTNYCGMCTAKANATNVQHMQHRNTGLEHLLRAFKYPCAQKNCDVLLHYNELLPHAQTAHALIPCLLKTCANLISVAECVDHFNTLHGVKTIKAVNRRFDIPILLNRGGLAHKGTLNIIANGCARLLFVCDEHENFLSVAFYNDPNVDMGNNEYHVKLTTNLLSSQTQVRYSGNLIAFKEDVTDATINMYIGSAANCNLSVTIGADLDEILDDHECPICMNACGELVRQCCTANGGHIICNNCAGKISSCPICRCSMNSTVINLKRLYPRLQRSCANRQHGCLAVGTTDSLDVHAQVCEYRDWTCATCAQVDRWCNMITHYRTAHQLNANFYVARLDATQRVGTANVVHEAYILFDNHVFKCTLAYSTQFMLSYTCVHHCVQGNCSKQTHLYRNDLHFINDTKAIAYYVRSEIHDERNKSYKYDLLIDQKRKVTMDVNCISVRICFFDHDEHVNDVNVSSEDEFAGIRLAGMDPLCSIFK